MTIMPIRLVVTMDQVLYPVPLPLLGQSSRQKHTQSHHLRCEKTARAVRNESLQTSVDPVNSYPVHSQYERDWAG